MTQKEADEIVLGMGCHPYSRLAMIDALLEGEKIGKKEQKAIANKRKEELLQYLEELEAHYRDLGQYDDGKPIRRVVEYIESMKE